MLIQKIFILFSLIILGSCDNSVPTNTDKLLINSNNSTVSIGNLIWKKCSEGQTWNGKTCTGKASKFKWKAVQNHAKGVSFANHNDWRVPTIKELNTLVYCSNGYQVKYKKDGFDDKGDCDKGGKNNYQQPTINQTLFPNTPISYFWSASPDMNSSLFAWIVSFDYGHDSSVDRDFSNRLRLVRFGE